MNELIERYPCLVQCKDDITHALSLIIDTYKRAVSCFCAVTAAALPIVSILSVN